MGATVWKEAEVKQKIAEIQEVIADSAAAEKLLAH